MNTSIHLSWKLKTYSISFHILLLLVRYVNIKCISMTPVSFDFGFLSKCICFPFWDTLILQGATMCNLVIHP